MVEPCEPSRNIEGEVPLGSIESARSNITAADYVALSAAPERAIQWSTQDLFQLASALAVGGNLQGKNEVLRWVRQHPQASAEDLLRVTIAELDWQRRTGNPVQALSGLELLHTDDRIVPEVERQQAMTQCLLLLARRAETVADKIPMLERAAISQEHAAMLGLQSDAFPPDKKIYFLVGLCEARSELMRASGACSDAIIERAHAICDLLAEDPRLDPVFRSRVAWELPINRGTYLRDCGRFGQAADDFGAAWLMLRDSDNDRYKCCVAIQYLFCSLQVTREESVVHDGLLLQTREYLAEHGQSFLLPSDVAVFRAELAFLSQRSLI